MKEQCIEEKELQELRRTLIEQESLTRELFELLGTSTTELDGFLREKSRFTKEVWDLLEAERARLENTIDQKKTLKKKGALPHIKKHWIQVR